MFLFALYEIRSHISPNINYQSISGYLHVFHTWPYTFWQTIGKLAHGEDYFSHSQHFLDAWSPLCMVEAYWNFLQPTLAWLLLLSLFTSWLGSHICHILWVWLLTLPGDTVSEKTPWLSASYNLSTPSSNKFPEPLVWTLFCRYIHGTELHNSAFLLVGFNEISVCCK